MSRALGHVALLGRGHRRQVEALRFATLTDTGTFTARRDAVEWCESDERSKVFGVFDSAGVLLSTLRAELLSAPEDLPPKLDYDRMHERVELPCGLLGKGGTLPAARGSGLLTYLMYLGYQELYAEGVRHVAVTVMRDSPLQGQLLELGYELWSNPAGWHRYGYDSRGPTLVGALDLRRHYGRLMGLLGSRVAGLERAYPWVRPYTHCPKSSESPLPAADSIAI